MAERQVRIDLTAQDDASATIKDVARAAEGLEKIDPTVDVAADTRQAQRSVEDLLRVTGQLSDEDATIVLKLRAGSVQRDLEDALSTVEQLDASDPEVQVQLERAADARADLDKLQTALAELDQTTAAPKVDTSGVDHYADRAGKAQDATHSFVGNALSELPGVSSTFSPLGEAVGQMTEGLLNGSVAMSGLIAAAGPIAGVTVLVKLIGDAFERQKKRAEEAKRETKEWRKALEDAASPVDAIADRIGTLIQDNEDLAAAMELVKVTGGDIRDALQGKVVPSLEDARDVIRDANKAVKEGTWPQFAEEMGMTADEANRYVDAAKEVTGEVDDQNGKFQTANTQVDRNTRLMAGLGDANATSATQIEDAAEALEHSNEQLDIMLGRLDMEQEVKELGGVLVEQMQKSQEGIQTTDDELWDMQRDVIQIAKDFNRSPVEVQTALEALERGDFQAVWTMVQGWMNQQPLHQPVTLDVELNRSAISDFLSSQGIIVPQAAGSAAPAVNVTQVFPRGFRTVGAIEEARSAARRHGGLYRQARR